VTAEIITRVYEAIRKERKGEKWLTRLGASSIGAECLRQTFLSWRGFAFSDFDGRMLRLFETGHLQEARVVADLRRAGFAVWDKTEEGKQFTYTDTSGHLVVKLDGVIKGVPGDEKTPHVLEIKTHSSKNFAPMVKKGVKLGKPDHYIQTQVGMWLSGLTKALYVAINKDDEQYHMEVVEYDEEAVADIQERVLTLLQASLTPAGISTNRDKFPCGWCDMAAVCYREVPPERNCRTCRSCDPIDDGDWVCQLTGSCLSKTEQEAACDQYSSRI
jgi:hypothetical protein